MSAADTDYREVAITTDWQLILPRDPDRRQVWTSADVDFNWVYYDLLEDETEPPFDGISKPQGTFEKDTLPSAAAYWVKGSEAGTLSIYLVTPTQEPWP